MMLPQCLVHEIYILIVYLKWVSMENPIDEITYNNDAQRSSIHSSYTLTNKTKKKTRGLILKLYI